MSQAVASMGPLALLLLGLVGADYSHHEDYMQGDFFEKWDFISANDPTHGFVDYVTAEKAKAENLIRTDANGIFIGVDNRSVVAPGARGRMSVRLESTARYNDGLFIISLEHAPTGCGSWPAFWMFGEDADHVWPEWGEFDIMEWIHEEEEVSTTLHTKENCTQEHLYPGWHMKGKWNKGKWNTNNAHDCYVHADGQWTNQGCSQRGLHGSVGPSFNAAGGGTYAAEWDPVAGHMRVWVWHSGQEPADVKSKMPNPMLWGQPDFYFALSDNCHPLHFKNMKLVFDITFCGDLAGPATFKQHCGKKKRGKKQRKYKDCVAFVRDEYEEFYDTYWSVQALDVYRRTDISSSPELAGVQTDLRQCRSEHTTKLQKRIQELESILFMKDAELRELYASLKAETQDMPPGHGRPVMSMDS